MQRDGQLHKPEHLLQLLKRPQCLPNHNDNEDHYCFLIRLR